MNRFFYMVFLFVFILVGCESKEEETAWLEHPCVSGGSVPAGAVLIESGLVMGSADKGSMAYLGIPYAAPPVGPLRWKPPEAHGCFEQPFEASDFGPACPQAGDDGVVFGDEDCLHLNVWTPQEKGDTPLPVMVFIHGGGHYRGSSGQMRDGLFYSYAGGHLAKVAPAVVVTFNYRLGTLGFLAMEALTAESVHDSSGNYGFLDQIRVLEWVRDNIEAFGGDPNRVMAFGHHSGGGDVTGLIASPLAKGLFHAAALQSARYGVRSLKTGELMGAKMLEATSCAEEEEPLDCLRGLPVKEMVEALPGNVDFDQAELKQEGENYYELHEDGWALFADPRVVIAQGQHAEMPMMVGTTSKESAGKSPATLPDEAAFIAQVEKMFEFLAEDVLVGLLAQYPLENYESPTDAFVSLNTDFRFTYPAWDFAKTVTANQEAPVYWYVFDHTSTIPNGTCPPTFGADILHLFGLFSQFEDIFSPTEPDQAMMSMLAAYWVHHARTGDPNGDGMPLWESFDASRNNALIFNQGASMSDGVCESCGFWATYAETYSLW